MTVALSAPFPLLYTGSQWATIVGLIVGSLLLKLVVILWIRRDAVARGRDPTWWMVVAIISELPTLIVWLIMRPRAATASSPSQAAPPAPPGWQPTVPSTSPRVAPPAPSSPSPASGSSPGAAQSSATGAAQSSATGAPARPLPENPAGASTGAYTVGFAGGVPLDSPDAPPVRQVTVTCPRCSQRFPVEKAGDLPAPVQCPACGASGQV